MNSMIRILHTADWHLGQTFFGYDRTHEHEFFLHWLTEEVNRQEVDVLIIAGDVFDVSNPSAYAQKMFFQFIFEITSQNPLLQVVIISGNHDSAARLEAPLPLLQAMRTEVRGVVLRKEDGTIDYDHLIIELKNKKGEVELVCMTVPFLRQGDYPAVDTDGNTYAEGVRELYTQLYTVASMRKKANQAIIAVGHLQATGSEIAEKDYSERTVIGGLECVSPDAFAQNVAYVALGHIHKSQRVSGRENVRYSGSPLPMSFAERNYHHGVVLVTFNGEEVSEIKKLECPLLTSLVSIPNEGPLPPEQIFSELRALPDVDGEAPYLEVKVLLDEPEPMIKRDVEEALDNKNYRLARIVPTYRKKGIYTDESDQSDEIGLQEMNPIQIVKSTFEKTYQTEMPEDLVDLLGEVCFSVANQVKKEDEE